MNFIILTVENAEEFFKRCIYEEVVTEKDRLKIIEGMKAEGKVLTEGCLDDKLSKGLGRFFEQTKHKGVIGLKRKDKE